MRVIGRASATSAQTSCSCSSWRTVTNGEATLNPGEQLICTAEYTVLQSDVNAGQKTWNYLSI